VRGRKPLSQTWRTFLAARKCPPARSARAVVPRLSGALNGHVSSSVTPYFARTRAFMAVCSATLQRYLGDRISHSPSIRMVHKLERPAPSRFPARPLILSAPRRRCRDDAPPSSTRPGRPVWLAERASGRRGPLSPRGEQFPSEPELMRRLEYLRVTVEEDRFPIYPGFVFSKT
jgi:hypothetical protein